MQDASHEVKEMCYEIVDQEGNSGSDEDTGGNDSSD